MKVISTSLAFSLLFLVSTYTFAEVKNVLGKEQFNDVVLKSSNPVVVKFGAPWCPACVRSKAPFEKISNDPENANITFVEMDFDKNSAVAQEYDVQSLPTFLYFSNGKLAATKTGFSENLKNEIANTVASISSPTTEKKSEETPAAAPTASQEEVKSQACAPTEGGILQSISNFFTSVWNSVTGWFK